MIDYEHMTDNDLRRAIAERLGWRLEDTPDGRNRRLINPRGELNSFTRWHTMEELFNSPEMTNRAAFVPDWPRDANAATGLLTGFLWAEIHWNSFVNQWTAVYPDEMGAKGYEGSGATLARAVCICWLRWHDARGDK
jgi:hypothetical protein